MALEKGTVKFARGGDAKRTSAESKHVDHSRCLTEAFRRILRKHGYPPDLADEATKLVLQQAELLCAEWAA
jgi:hypothetical protein